MSWLHMFFAMICGIVATAALRTSSRFAELLPSAVAIAGFAMAFYSLWLALQGAAADVAQAVWSGAGIAFIMTVTWGCIRSNSKR